MGALRPFAAALMLMPAPANAETVADWRPYIVEASSRFGIPIAWIERVMRAESGGQTRRNGLPIRSSAGAMGLMQLMPATWAEIRVRLGLGSDPDNPRDNILAGTFYLRMMYDRFGYPGLFGAYNAGPGRYAEHLANGRPLPAETVGYLASVTYPTSRVAQIAAPVRTSDPMFVVRKLSSQGAEEPGQPTTLPSLFIALSNGD